MTPTQRLAVVAIVALAFLAGCSRSVSTPHNELLVTESLSLFGPSITVVESARDGNKARLYRGPSIISQIATGGGVAGGGYLNRDQTTINQSQAGQTQVQGQAQGTINGGIKP